MNERFENLDQAFRKAYEEAEKLIKDDTDLRLDKIEPFASCIELTRTKHAFRGAALTLIGYKLIEPTQDIRAHKDEQEGGFSARTYDNKVTVPFLIEKNLPKSVESHWLTQTLSFSSKLVRGTNLKTQPEKAGRLLVEVVNNAEEADKDTLWKMLVVIMFELIKIRNQGKVILTRPKNLPIDLVKKLLEQHFSFGYKSNTPRLPQLAVYAVYMAIIDKMSRFSGQSIEALQRMKSADRKSGTVGDIVLIDGSKNPVEAVEIKYGQPITIIHVAEAIEKVRGASVSRYYLLSTNGIAGEDLEQITAKQLDFLKQNGCEIIVNGVIETIGYYLRLVPNTSEFISHYAELVESDEDTGYEHRIAWNEICSKI